MAEKKYSRYEKTRIISSRALQIDQGSPVLVKSSKGEPIELAEMEWKKHLVPIDVKKRV